MLRLAGWSVGLAVVTAYSTTEVSVERSQGGIRKLLVDHNVEKLGFGEERDEMGVRWAAVTFTFRTLIVRIKVPLKLVDEREVSKKVQRNRSGKDENAIRNEMYEQEEKRIWRVLAWGLKARLVAVDEGVETFEQSFLPHLLNPETGRTIYESLAEDGHVELPTPLLALPEHTG